MPSPRLMVLGEVTAPKIQMAMAPTPRVAKSNSEMVPASSGLTVAHTPSTNRALITQEPTTLPEREPADLSSHPFPDCKVTKQYQTTFRKNHAYVILMSDLLQQCLVNSRYNLTNR